jgi:predicted Zn finger-like uncharacterized protein
MRLSCPNCGVEYEVPEALVPEAGRHVQCTACHTRWFVRPGAVSEDQILSRLEQWSPRPRLVAAAPDAPDPDDVGNFLWEEPEDSGPPEPDPAAAARPAAALEPAAAEPASRRDALPKPGERPEVAGPAPRELRRSPRLELDTGARRGPEAAAPKPASRFGHGLVLVLAIFAAAFAAYRFRGEIAAQVPAARPALEAYGAEVDALRDRVEGYLAPLRPSGG